MSCEIPLTEQITQFTGEQLTHISNQLRPDLQLYLFTKPPLSLQTFIYNEPLVRKHMQLEIA